MLDNKIHEESIQYIKNHKKELIDKFILSIGCRPIPNPATIFMAGSPGAGKTEFSKNFIVRSFPNNLCIRIDADDIRDIIPAYNGSNSEEVQSAACLGVEKLYDYVLKHNYNALVDGTLASYKVAEENIARSLKRGRIVSIFYIYQDPKIAWYFTKVREKVEGRHISKEIFIDSLFLARDNVNKLKDLFKEKIKVFLVEKNFEHQIAKFEINVRNLDNHIKIGYDKVLLAKILEDSI